jgi:hypothetical protein
MLLKTFGLHVGVASAIFLISSGMASAGATQVATIGPIDQVNCSTGTYRVLGVNFKAASRSAMANLCELTNSAGLQYVVATGLRGETGKVAGSLLAKVKEELYVPGATVVFVRGPVSRTYPATGEFEVAGTKVISLTGQSPALGVEVDVIGTQPLVGAVVVAEAIYPASDARTNSDSRIAKAIIGSGASKKAIIGSGSSTNAIIGSGSESEAIIGSGADAMAIIGSGANSKAIIGSGASSKAIIGSGATKSAIIGSGSSTSAIIGSGASNLAIIGSGASASAIIGSGANY